MILSTLILTATLLSFPSFNASDKVHNSLFKIIVCCRVLAGDSGPESELAKTLPTPALTLTQADSDRLQSWS